MVLLVDRKFTADQLKVRRNQAYAEDLLTCLRIFKKWGYDIIWVDEGIDAMRAVKSYASKISLILMEASMPTRGTTMTRMIRLNPEATGIPVALMSAQFSTADLEEATKAGANECLPKPFTDPSQIEIKLSAVRETTRQKSPPSQDRVSHILKELNRIDDLPVMAPVFSEIERLSRDPKATTEDYRAVIELDVAITSQLLRLSNSAAFSFTRKITSVTDAINLLGLRTVVNFVRTLSVIGSFRKYSRVPFAAQEFWLHAIACGVTARTLAARPEIQTALRSNDIDPFMAGMVHDIGKMVFGYFFTDLFQLVIDTAQGQGRSLYEIETDVLGITHAEVGAALAARWQLPESLAAVIGGHHAPPDDASPATALVHVANAACKMMGFAFKERKPDDLFVADAALTRLNLDLRALSPILSDIGAQVRDQITETYTAIFK
jgi:HD-like signal output (HDOD) protein